MFCSGIYAISALIYKTELITIKSNTTMFKKSLVLIAAALLFLAGCQKPPLLTLSGDSTVEVVENGGSATITFTANRDWSVAPSDSWIHVSPSSGSASDKPVSVTVSCDPNTTYGERNGTVSIKAEDLSQTVSVKQAANGGLIVQTKSYEVGASATTIDVVVQSNVSFSAQISADWIRQTGTKALSESTLVFSIDENKSFEERNATITLSGAGLTQTVTVKQAAAENPAKDLCGVWIASYGLEDGATQADYETMHVDILEIREDGTFETRIHSDVTDQGTWSFKDDKLYFKPAEGQGVPDWDAGVILTGGKAWLVLVVDDEYEIDGTTYRNRVFNSYKKVDATVESEKLSDGRWDATHDGLRPEAYTDEVDYNMCLKVEGSKVDLYVPVWGLHIQGTFTLSNGLMNITTDEDHIWKALVINVTDQYNYDFGWNAGNMNPETFELLNGYSWYSITELKAMGKKPNPSDPEYIEYPYKFKFAIYERAENELDIAMELCRFGLCVAESGMEAYGGAAGMGRCFYKRP